MVLRNCTLVVFNHRVHHFAFGLGLIGIGAVMLVDDREDFLRWLLR